MRCFTDPELNIMTFSKESIITASNGKSELSGAVGKDNYAETEDYKSMTFVSMGS